MPEIDYEAADKKIKSFLNSGALYNYELFLDSKQHVKKPDFLKALGALKEIRKLGLERARDEKPALIEQALKLGGCPMIGQLDADEMIQWFRGEIASLLSMNRSSSSEPKVDAAEQHYQSLKMDLPHLMRGPTMQAFDQLAQCYPEDTGPLIDLENGKIERLTLPQINSLIDLSNNIRLMPHVFQGNYQKIVKTLFDIRSTMYTASEMELAQEMNNFWREHGQNLAQAFKPYVPNPPKPMRQLGELLAVAKGLNSGPDWDEYEVNMEKLHDEFTAATRSSTALSQPTYNALLRAPAAINTALGTYPTSGGHYDKLLQAGNAYDLSVKPKVKAAFADIQDEMQKTLSI